MSFREFLKENKNISELVDLEEGFIKSIGYRKAEDAINLLEKVLNPKSALCINITQKADNVVKEFIMMQKHIESIVEIWEDIDYVIGMSNQNESNKLTDEFVMQKLADKDINSKIENNTIYVDKSEIKNTQKILKSIGCTKQVKENVK